MAMKDRFLKEVKIGDQVSIMIGTKDMEGIIVSLDLDTVQIRRDNGKKPVIALDLISYYEVDNTKADDRVVSDGNYKGVILDEGFESGENGRKRVPSKNPHPDDSKGDDKVVNDGNDKGIFVDEEFARGENGRKRVPSEKSHPDELEKNLSLDKILTELEKRGNSFFQVMDKPIAKSVKEVSKMTEDTYLRYEINAISDSIDYAINKCHESSPADYKLQDNIVKIKRLIKKYPKSKTPNDLLGALYVSLKCDGLALEAYENGNDNVSAYVIAEKLKDEKKELLFSVRHFIYDKNPSAFIYKYLLGIMIGTDDYSLCTKVTSKDLSSANLRAYHSFFRAILLANNISYNAMLDFDVTIDGLEDLLKIFKTNSIGTKNELITLLQTKKDIVNAQVNSLDTRSMNECPTFAAAEVARMEEKNYFKAEKLYIRAIERKEKPGSAVANLYQILVTQKRYKECAMYLGKYGYKYMREDAYNNLKKQLFIIAPQLRSEVSKYEKNDTEPTDYFVLAQKAEIEEKDFQKAIAYYKKAIISGKRLSGAVPNLVSIYSRFEMFTEALDLLNKEGKNVMDRNSFLNLKQSVLIKAKDGRYKKEIDDTFDQLIEITSSLERVTEIAASKANLLYQIAEYEEAIKSYEFCLKNCDRKGFSSEKKDRVTLYVLIGLCNVYIHMNNIAKAQEYAERVVKIDSNNEFARSILSGNTSANIEFIEENIGVTHINEYIRKHIEELSLDSEVKVKKLLEEGCFIGTQDKAASILNSILDPRNRSVNEEAKSNQYLAGAKLIHQILERDEEIDTDKFNEQRYLYFIAEGTCSYANSRLYRNELADNLDVARYFYIQPITIFNDSEALRSSWAVATIRYIQTYFESVDSIRKTGNSIYQRFKDHDACLLAIQKIMQNPIRTDVRIFTIGIMELLTYNTRIKKKVLGLINANAFQGRILDILAKMLRTDVPDVTSVDDFANIWDMATEAYYDLRKSYLRLISETIESLFAVGQLQENLEKVKRSPFNNFLNNTDQEYIHELYEIFKSIARYNEIGEFDYKADTLKHADDDRKMLEEKINEYPTYLSYEKLLPQLEQIQIKILRESVTLYGDSEPQLSVVLSGDCSFEADKMIARVPIAYTNKANCQNADNVQMSIWGEGVENVDDTVLSRDLWIGDGRAKEKMLIFKVSEKVLEDQAFSIEVSISYQYKKNMTELEDDSANFVLTVPLYSESIFEPIENKFKIISGGDPVHDKSMFYGRDKDIASIISQIKNAPLDSKSGKCLVLYGQTRTGKSSILHHLQVQLREQGEENIIIDMESLGKLGLNGNNITEFLYKLLRTFNKEITKHHPELASIIKASGIDMDAKSLLSNPDQSQLRFNEIFDDVYEIIKEQEKAYHIVLMIDEFTYIYDWIRQGTMTDRIMKFWKAFMQTHNIFAVIIGQDHMMQFMADRRFTNDFGIMELMKVSYLSKDDAQRLMDEPIMYVNEHGERISRYKEGALDRLYELTSGSAFLIGKLCAGLVEYLNDTHSVFITRAHIDDYIKKMLPTFDQINFDPQYRDLSEIGEESTIVDQNKAMLQRIAECSNKKEYTPIEDVVHSEEDRRILNRLEQRDVIIISNGERCKIKVALYKEWLIARSGMGVL